MFKKIICSVFVFLVFISPVLASDTSSEVDWVKSLIGGPYYSAQFLGVTSDKNGNIYAVGFVNSKESSHFTLTYGDKTINSTYNQNGVIVKYNSSGEVNWVKTGVGTSTISSFDDVATDNDGNIYIVGSVLNTKATFKEDRGKFTLDSNAVIVKYNSSGNVLWTKSVTDSLANSLFKGIAVDKNGNIYAVGYVSQKGSYTFGNQTIKVDYPGYNGVVVKYNSSGEAQWVKSTNTRIFSMFEDVTVGRDNSIYVVGNFSHSGSIESINFGKQIVTGGYNGYNSSNALIIKYNDSGEVDWARSTAAGTSNTTRFFGVATNNNGNIYAVGQIYGNSKDFVFFDDKSVRGGYSGFDQNYNPLIVEYNSAGKVAWVKSSDIGSSVNSHFSSVTTDKNGNPYAVGSGSDRKPGLIAFDGQVINGGYNKGFNYVIVRYDTSGKAQWAQSSVEKIPISFQFKDVTSDNKGNIYAVGYGTGSFTFGDQILDLGSTSYNTAIVKYKNETAKKHCFLWWCW